MHHVLSKPSLKFRSAYLAITVDIRKFSHYDKRVKKLKFADYTHLSQALNIQAQIIHNESMKTPMTVPGNIVINVFRTNLVLNVILLRAPMLRDDASVNSLLCRSITRTMR